MQLNNLKRKNKNKKSTQVGRGGKRGKTSGKGTKGQNARAGRKKRPEIRDTIKRLPKLRGRGKNIFKSISGPIYTVNVGVINKIFSDGAVVNPTILIEKGIFRHRGSGKPRVKILGDGQIDKKFNFESVLVSKSAEEKIKKAGGNIK